MSLIFERLSDIKEPCKGCGLRRACAKEELACLTFAHFVSSGQTCGRPIADVPSSSLYQATMKSDTVGDKHFYLRKLRALGGAA